MPLWVEAVLTAFVSGALVVMMACGGLPLHVSSTRCWGVFLMGAAVGLVNWWRTPPSRMTR